jgi:hypothetical protein
VKNYNERFITSLFPKNQIATLGMSLTSGGYDVINENFGKWRADPKFHTLTQARALACAQLIQPPTPCIVIVAACLVFFCWTSVQSIDANQRRALCCNSECGKKPHPALSKFPVP